MAIIRAVSCIANVYGGTVPGRISSRRITLRESLASTRPAETKKHTDISIPLGLLLITAHEAWLVTAQARNVPCCVVQIFQVAVYMGPRLVTSQCMHRS
jgi:hypothetical protein